MDRVLYLGRFQPFHKGHHHVVSRLKEENDLVVGIGSSDRHHEEENPLNFFERYRVLKNCFPRLEIVAVPDRKEDPPWTRQILEKIDMDRVVCSNPVTKSCFRKEGYPMEEHPEFLDRDRYRGTYIRNRITDGKSWEDLVPECSLEILKDIGLEERLREIHS